MKKQLFLLLAFVMTGAVAMAQNAGVWMVGGTFGISTSKTSYTHENVTQVREKQTDFNIIPSLHYFQYFGNLILNYFNRVDSLITPHPFGQATLARSPHFGA